MAIDNIYNFGIAVIIIAMILIIASLAIPFAGFLYKRWKGLALGCVLQPVSCFIIVVAAVFISEAYSDRQEENMRRQAMVTLKGEEPDSVGYQTAYWYLKPDEECYFEIPDKDEDKIFDVVRLDSVTLTVEDRIVVTLDTCQQKATATDWGKPVEIVGINWDALKAYLGKNK